MPVWTQYIVGIAAVLVALGVIWKKLVQPLAKLITMLTEAMPLMETLVVVFKDTPGAFEVLKEIQKQFRTDSGSSLRDVVNRLEEAAIEQRAATDAQTVAAGVLAVGVEAVKQVAAVDREQQRQFGLYLDRLGVKVQENVASMGRIEKHASDVADDLAASHRRADDVTGVPGTAADAAAQQTTQEKRDGDNAPRLNPD